MGWLSDIKDKIVDDIIPNEVKSGSAAKKAIRNLIPNELADVAVKGCSVRCYDSWSTRNCCLNAWSW